MNTLFWLLPLIIGAVIAALNKEGINDTTEKIESWSRRKFAAVTEKGGWFNKIILQPVLWLIVKFSDWTDSFEHRGLKNGVRVAISLYLLWFWIYLVLMAFMFVLSVAIFIGILYVLFKVLLNSSDDFRRGYNMTRGVFDTGSANSNQSQPTQETQHSRAEFSIRILDKYDRPYNGVNVAVSGSTSGLLFWPYFQERKTGSDGWAHFYYEYFGDYNMEGDVEVDGSHVGKVAFADGGTASFTVSWSK